MNPAQNTIKKHNLNFPKMIHYSISFRRFLDNSNSPIGRYLDLAEAHFNNPSHPACEWETKYSKHITNKEIDYLTFRNDGTISYLPAGKEHQGASGGEWKPT